MNDLMEEALKDIKNWRKDFPEAEDRTMRYWFKRFYSQGKIEALEWAIENNKKHGK